MFRMVELLRQHADAVILCGIFGGLILGVLLAIVAEYNPWLF